MSRQLINKILNLGGIEVSRFAKTQPSKLLTLFNDYQVDLILDIGANIGQSAKHFRAIGYQGKIISLEPIQHLFKQLKLYANNDPKLLALNSAVGAQTGRALINVSGNSAVASSILGMSPNVVTNAPDQVNVGVENIAMTTLDQIMLEHYPHGLNCFLKLDVQGYERNVLEGAKSSLRQVVGMKIEMSLVENYFGELLMHEMIPLLYEMGFRLCEIEPGWGNAETGELYQVDGIFFRPERWRS